MKRFCEKRGRPLVEQKDVNSFIANLVKLQPHEAFQLLLDVDADGPQRLMELSRFPVVATVGRRKDAASFQHQIAVLLKYLTSRAFTTTPMRHLARITVENLLSAREDFIWAKALVEAMSDVLKGQLIRDSAFYAPPPVWSFLLFSR